MNILRLLVESKTGLLVSNSTQSGLDCIEQREQAGTYLGQPWLLAGVEVRTINCGKKIRLQLDILSLSLTEKSSAMTDD